MGVLEETRITWLGHATVLIQTPRGANLLIDPFIGRNPRYPKGFELPEIHYVLVTHGHMDHMADAVPVAKRYGAPVVAMYELAAYLEGKGAKETIGMNLGGTVQLRDAAVTMVEAKHSSSVQDDAGTHYAGLASGFVISIAGGPVLYHAGDTSLFSDMKLIGELYRPQVAMLPIGGHYTMGPEDAALALTYLGSKKVLPLHFGTFPQLAGTPDELAQHAGPGIEVIQVTPGGFFIAAR